MAKKNNFVRKIENVRKDFLMNRQYKNRRQVNHQEVNYRQLRKNNWENVRLLSTLLYVQKKTKLLRDAQAFSDVFNQTFATGEFPEDSSDSSYWLYLILNINQ